MGPRVGYKSQKDLQRKEMVYQRSLEESEGTRPRYGVESVGLVWDSADGAEQREHWEQYLRPRRHLGQFETECAFQTGAGVLVDQLEE